MIDGDSNLFWGVLHEAPSLQSVTIEQLRLVTIEQRRASIQREFSFWRVFVSHLTMYCERGRQKIKWLRLPIVGLVSQLRTDTVEALCRMQGLYLLVAPLARMAGVEQTSTMHLHAKRLTGFAGYCRRRWCVGSLERTRRPWVTSPGRIVGPERGVQSPGSVTVGRFSHARRQRFVQHGRLPVFYPGRPGQRVCVG